MGCHREIHSDRAQRSELQAHRETLFDVQNLFMCASRFAHTYTRTLTHTKIHTRTQCHKRNQCTHTHIGIYLTCQQPGKIGSVPAIILPFLLNIARLYDSEPRTEARVHKDGNGPGFLYRLISVERKLNQGERKLALVVLAGRLRNQTLADVETMNKKKQLFLGLNDFSRFFYTPAGRQLLFRHLLSPFPLLFLPSQSYFLWPPSGTPSHALSLLPVLSCVLMRMDALCRLPPPHSMALSAPTLYL